MLRSETCSLFCRERCKTRDKPLILPWITDEFHVNRICCVEKSKPFNMISRELRLCYEYVTDLRERNSQTMLYFSMRWNFVLFIKYVFLSFYIKLTSFDLHIDLSLHMTEDVGFPDQYHAETKNKMYFYKKCKVPSRSNIWRALVC